MVGDKGHRDVLGSQVRIMRCGGLAPTADLLFRRSFFTFRLWRRKLSYTFADLHLPTNPVAVSQGNWILVCTIVSRCYGILFQSGFLFFPYVSVADGVRASAARSVPSLRSHHTPCVN